MSTGFFTDTILTLAVPAAFVAGAWALAVCALNLSDQQTQWFHRLYRRNSASSGNRSSAANSKNNVANPKDI